MINKLVSLFSFPLLSIFLVPETSFASDLISSQEYEFNGIKVVRYHYGTVDTTQEVVSDHIEELSQSRWVMVSAGEQTEGIGMWGRSWVSPPGNVFVTYAIPLDETQMSSIGNFPWIFGVVLARTLQKFGINPQLRYPNNAIVDHKKIAGILCEVYSDVDYGHFLCAGFGINVFMTEDQCRKIDQSATSLCLESDTLPSVDEVIEELTAQICRTIFNETTPIFDEYENLLAYKGEKVEVFDGNNRYPGTFMGVTSEGLMRLRQNNGEVKIFPSAEISPRQNIESAF